MKILTLSIKQKYFDQILEGTKKNEIREIRPKNFKKYARYVFNGVESEEDIWGEDDDVAIVPVKYDAIKLLTGEYKGTRPWLLVEVAGADIFIETDEKGEDIVYEEDGKEYVAAGIEYKLGKILDRSQAGK